jgi:hypothetical protein
MNSAPRRTLISLRAPWFRAWFRETPATDAGTISGPNDEFVTTDAMATRSSACRSAALETSSAPKRRTGRELRLRDRRPGLHPDRGLGLGCGGFRQRTARRQGDGGNGSITGHCWATVLGDGGPPINGAITPGADSILTSPDMSSPVSPGPPSVRCRRRCVAGDTLEVRVRDAADERCSTRSPRYLPSRQPQWQTFDFALPATTNGKTIYLEFRFQGANASYLGFYLDDVTITY